jgi:hypothetical protein
MDQDTLDKLASGEYSISPRSGRLRRKVRIRKREDKFFKKRRVKRFLNTAVWVVLIGGFILSIIYIIPELNITSDKKKTITAPSGR